MEGDEAEEVEREVFLVLGIIVAGEVGFCHTEDAEALTSQRFHLCEYGGLLRIGQ